MARRRGAGRVDRGKRKWKKVTSGPYREGTGWGCRENPSKVFINKKLPPEVRRKTKESHKSLGEKGGEAEKIIREFTALPGAIRKIVAVVPEKEEKRERKPGRGSYKKRTAT